jgi:hypothetical protein
MKKNDDRKTAETTFLNDRGRITNKELAKKLGVHPATVARWKKLDEWDLKLIQTVSGSQQTKVVEDEFFNNDLRHIAVLNDRIELYLQKKELLPSEILELAEAKYHILSCIQIINDQLSYSNQDDYDLRDDDYE